MVESWVRGETASARFCHLYESAAAKAPGSPSGLLGTVRGCPDREYFRGFPPDVQWALVELDEQDVAQVLYIDWEYWKEVSGGTRSAQQAAALMGWTEGIDWNREVEPMVLVTDDAKTRLVVLEGHSRLTAYVLDAGDWQRPVLAYLGSSHAMVDWWAF